MFSICNTFEISFCTLMNPIITLQILPFPFWAKHVSDCQKKTNRIFWMCFTIFHIEITCCHHVIHVLIFLCCKIYVSAPFWQSCQFNLLIRIIQSCLKNVSVLKEFSVTPGVFQHFQLFETNELDLSKRTSCSTR